jgi:hypothetical protein
MNMKKNKRFIVALAFASLALSSCGTTAVATLKNGSDPFASTNGVAIDGNKLKELYELVRSSSSYNSDVKTLLNVGIAENYLGHYSMNSTGDIVLDEWDGKTDSEKLDFIKKHSAYRNWTETGTFVTFEELSDVSANNLSQYDKRIDMIKTIIKKEVVSELFSAVNVSTYKKNNRFFEILYIQSLLNNLNVVYQSDGTTELTDIQSIYDQIKELDKVNYVVPESFSGEYSTGILLADNYDPDKNVDNIISGDKPLIHIGHYVDYVNTNILPGIMTKLLTEQYILENQYPAIGRSQQRLIQYIALSDTNTKASTLLTNYINQYLTTKVGDIDLSIATSAWNGIYSDLEEENQALAKSIATSTFGEATNVRQNPQIDTGANVTYIDGNPTNYYYYYKNSQYGDLIKKYSTLTNNPRTNDSSNYTYFTSIDSKDYSSDPTQGLAIQTDAIRSASYLGYGRGTKTDYSSLPSDAKNKLFEYGIISELARAYEDGDAAEKAVDRQYLKSFTPGGVTFLKKDSYNSAADSIIWEDSGKFYIIAVYDYISLSKLLLSKDEGDLDTIEQYARNVGYAIASSNTYTTDALTHYIDESSVAYFDQNVYDYFVEQFPTLFD